MSLEEFKVDRSAPQSAEPKKNISRVSWSYNLLVAPQFEQSAHWRRMLSNEDRIAIVHAILFEGWGPVGCSPYLPADQ
jgi:hypothetical protein